MKPVHDFRVLALAEIARFRRAGASMTPPRGFGVLTLAEMAGFERALEVR